MHVQMKPPCRTAAIRTEVQMSYLSFPPNIVQNCTDDTQTNLCHDEDCHLHRQKQKYMEIHRYTVSRMIMCPHMLMGRWQCMFQKATKPVGLTILLGNRRCSSGKTVRGGIKPAYSGSDRSSRSSMVPLHCSFEYACPFLCTPPGPRCCDCF